MATILYIIEYSFIDNKFAETVCQVHEIKP